MWALLEIGVSGRIYTWGNNQENHVMCKLDRIFCTTTFDAKFPLASARALSRSGSDHTPLIWYSGEAKVPKKGSSKF
jgi:endonuclease/exonuclease/phosphatase family metal-dependent hydrolase